MGLQAAGRRDAESKAGVEAKAGRPQCGLVPALSGRAAVLPATLAGTVWTHGRALPLKLRGLGYSSDSPFPPLVESSPWGHE